MALLGTRVFQIRETNYECVAENRHLQQSEIDASFHLQFDLAIFALHLFPPKTKVARLQVSIIVISSNSSLFDRTTVGVLF